jgi:hypothetical protein
MTEKTKTPVTEAFEQATKNYEQALKAGLKLQEDSGKWWANLLNQATTPQDWQERVKAMAGDLVPETQKRTEECLKLIEQTSKTNVELFKKAVEAAQSTSIAESQARFIGFCEASLNALKDTAETVAQANTRAIDAWVALARKYTEVPEAKAKA